MMKKKTGIVFAFLVVICITIVEILALNKGYNGKALGIYFGSIGLIVGIIGGKIPIVKWSGKE
jgi:uncharacterized membrane protein YraQ (UPF0718 family)